MECPDALKWGVLQDVGGTDSSQPPYVSFFHKLLQEFAAAWYIFKTIENVLWLKERVIWTVYI